MKKKKLTPYDAVAFQEGFKIGYAMGFGDGEVRAGIEIVLDNVRNGRLKSKDAVAFLKRVVKEVGLCPKIAQKAINEILKK